MNSTEPTIAVTLIVKVEYMGSSLIRISHEIVYNDTQVYTPTFCITSKNIRISNEIRILSSGTHECICLHFGLERKWREGGYVLAFNWPIQWSAILRDDSEYIRVTKRQYKIENSHWQMKKRNQRAHLPKSSDYEIHYPYPQDTFKANKPMLQCLIKIVW